MRCLTARGDSARKPLCESDSAVPDATFVATVSARCPKDAPAGSFARHAKKARSDHDVGGAIHDRCQQRGDRVGIVLTVGVEQHDRARVQAARVAEARVERLGFAAIALMPKHDRARLLGDPRGLIRRAVIDHDDLIDVLAGFQHDAADKAVFVIGRDDRDTGMLGRAIGIRQGVWFPERLLTALSSP